MNPALFVLGVLLIGTGFVTLIKQLHDRRLQESLVEFRGPRGDAGRRVTAFLGLLAPIVTSIAAGVGFVAVGLMRLSSF
jgi:hypothetical protein